MYSINSVDNIHNTIQKNIDNVHKEDKIKLQRAYNNVIKDYVTYVKCVRNGTYIDVATRNYLENIHKFSIIQVNNSIDDSIKIKINTKQEYTKKNTCICGGLYFKNPEGINCCSMCGVISSINKISSNKYNGDITKNNRYIHHQHYKKVYRCIFCLKDKIIKSEEDKINIKRLDTYVKEYCNINKICSKNLSHMWFRNVIQRMGFSESWLPDVNFIKQIITGYKIPKLTVEEEEKLDTYYKSYLLIFKKIRNPKESYKRCSYIIFKLIQLILDDSDERKKEILSHINLPERNTRQNLDTKWRTICDNSDGLFTYKITKI